MPLPVDTAETVFVLARHVAVEYFDDSALVLDMRQQTLTELDASQGWALSQLDGQSTMPQVASNYAANFVVAYDEALEAVRTVCEKLVEKRALRLVRGSWKGNGMGATRYIQNPDVNLRDEDEDGALLFNPDTGKVQLLNSTGFYIWKLCAEGSTVDELVAAFKADFEEVPEDQVVADVEEFVDYMMDSGFIGMLETP